MYFLNAAAMVIGVLLLGGCAARVPMPESDAQAPPRVLTGPGGIDGAYEGGSQSEHGFLDARFWIFQPAGAKSALLPVVVFLHGYGSIDPSHYREWIEHLVKRGHLVIYPAYQTWGGSPSFLMTPMARRAVRRGIAILQKRAAEGGPRPDLERVAAIGHSAGAIAAMNLVTDGVDALHFRAIMAIAPPDDFLLPESDYARVPNDTLLFCVAGADDTESGDAGARKLYRATTQIPADQKRFMVIPRDAHGSPVIFPDHGAAECAPGEATFIDYGIYWRLFDQLLDAAFHGTPVRDAIAPERLRRSGAWSDGVEVKALMVE